MDVAAKFLALIGTSGGESMAFFGEELEQNDNGQSWLDVKETVSESSLPYWIMVDGRLCKSPETTFEPFDYSVTQWKEYILFKRALSSPAEMQ